MDASATCPYSKKERRTKTFRVAHLERQTAARSHALHSGSLLRTADESAFTWVPSRSGMPYSASRDPDCLDRLSLAGGGRYRQILRSRILILLQKQIVLTMPARRALNCSRVAGSSGNRYKRVLASL